MTLYTMFFEYQGGTYIRQHAAAGPQQAIETAVTTLCEELKQSAQALAESVADCEIAPIDGCRNVWCVAGCVDDTLLLVHIIATTS